MKVIGIKLQKAGLIMMSVWSIFGMFSCEDRLDTPRPLTGEGKTVEVSLSVGIADEVDAASLDAGSTGTKGVGEGSNQAFDVRLTPSAVLTKSDALAGAKPDKLYNLQILQYDSNNNFKKLTSTVTQDPDPGSALTVALQPCDNCQLIIVARGSGNTIPEFTGTPSWSDLQGKLADAATINGINNTSGLNAMPYFIHLKNVNVTDNGTIIQSATGNDARILLKRLAVRLTVNWVFDAGLRTDYTLREVKLCQVPAVYYLMPKSEEPDSRFEGALYPISTVEYKDLYRLKGTAASNEGSLTTWMPANAKGRSRNVTSIYYRTKENAHTSATYMEFVVDKNDQTERLYYRAYLGGKDVSDFNLLENTNYNWTVKLQKADYRGDPRIQLLDQTPVNSTNLVPTSNCFMMRPGTNICFNPYKHEAGAGGENTYLSGKTIGSVRVLWQSKDAGTSGDLVMGYAVSNESGSYNHQNLVNYTDIGDKAKALVHVKVPVTQGGNAVIAAYAADGETILWSWHLWITDYVPARINKVTINSEDTRRAGLAKARTASVGGTVHQYRGAAWTYPSGSFYDKVIMDRNLGALRNTWSTNSALESARTYGNLYQWGRKDPMPGSADGGRDDIDVMFDGDGVSFALGTKPNSELSLDNIIQNPISFYTAGAKNTLNTTTKYLPSDSWGANKTIYDPCPAGWQVPDFGTSSASNIWSDFNSWSSLNMLVNSNWMSSSITVQASHFHVMNGMRYKISDTVDDYAWFPFIRMRDLFTGLLRDAYRDLETGKDIPFASGYLPCFAVYGASQGSSTSYGWYIEFKYKPNPPQNNVGYKPYAFGVRCVQDNN